MDVFLQIIGATVFGMAFLIGLILFLMRYVRHRREKKAFQRVIKSGIRSIDRMDGHQFEYFLAQLFKELGYRSVKETKRSNDFGADLVVKKEKKMVVQAKRYGYNNRVGIEAVQQVFAAKPFYQAQESWVVTNSFYTSSARKLAHACGVRLFDRWQLQQFIVEVNPTTTAQDVYETVEPAPRNCPACGSSLVVRSNKADTSRFFGCSKFPDCSHTEPLNVS